MLVPGSMLVPVPIFHSVLQICFFWFLYLIDGSGVSTFRTGSAFFLADTWGLAVGGQCPSDAGLLCGLVQTFSSQFPRSVLLALSGVNCCSQKPSPATCPLGLCPACHTTPIPEPAAHWNPLSWPCSARVFLAERAVPRPLLQLVKPSLRNPFTEQQCPLSTYGEKKNHTLQFGWLLFNVGLGVSLEYWGGKTALPGSMKCWVVCKFIIKNKFLLGGRLTCTSMILQNKAEDHLHLPVCNFSFTYSCTSICSFEMSKPLQSRMGEKHFTKNSNNNKKLGVLVRKTRTPSISHLG